MRISAELLATHQSLHLLKYLIFVDFLDGRGDGLTRLEFFTQFDHFLRNKIRSFRILTDLNIHNYHKTVISRLVHKVKSFLTFLGLLFFLFNQRFFASSEYVTRLSNLNNFHPKINVCT